MIGLAGAQVPLGNRSAVLPQVQEQVVLQAHWIEGMDQLRGHQKKITHGLGSTISSPPILRLPNCMPTFSRPEPKLFGSVTAWSVLNRALCL